VSGHWEAAVEAGGREIWDHEAAVSWLGPKDEYAQRYKDGCIERAEYVIRAALPHLRRHTSSRNCGRRPRLSTTSLMI
jgi:hypothetical protein